MSHGMRWAVQSESSLPYPFVVGCWSRTKPSPWSLTYLVYITLVITIDPFVPFFISMLITSGANTGQAVRNPKPSQEVLKQLKLLASQNSLAAAGFKVMSVDRKLRGTLVSQVDSELLLVKWEEEEVGEMFGLFGGVEGCSILSVQSHLDNLTDRR